MTGVAPHRYVAGGWQRAFRPSFAVIDYFQGSRDFSRPGAVGTLL